MVLYMRFSNGDYGVYIRNLTSGKLLNIRRVPGRRWPHTLIVVCSWLLSFVLYWGWYATSNGCSWTYYNPMKKVVIYQHAPGKLYTVTNVLVYSKRIGVVKSFFIIVVIDREKVDWTTKLWGEFKMLVGHSLCRNADYRDSVAFQTLEISTCTKLVSCFLFVFVFFTTSIWYVRCLLRYIEEAWAHLSNVLASNTLYPLEKTLS